VEERAREAAPQPIRYVDELFRGDAFPGRRAPDVGFGSRSRAILDRDRYVAADQDLPVLGLGAEPRRQIGDRANRV